MLSNINLHLMDSAAKIQSVLWPLLISPLLQKRDFKRERKNQSQVQSKLKFLVFVSFLLVGFINSERSEMVLMDFETHLLVLAKEDFQKYARGFD